MALNIVGWCPVCLTHRQLVVDNHTYECQTCKKEWDGHLFKPDAILYVSFVSHDDELTLVPILITDSAADAKIVCEREAERNGDRTPLNWNEGEDEPQTHSRVDGEFWQAEVKNDDGQTYTYYVRPARLQ